MEILEWREELLADESLLADDCDYYVDDAVEL